MGKQRLSRGIRSRVGEEDKRSRIPLGRVPARGRPRTRRSNSHRPVLVTPIADVPTSRPVFCGGGRRMQRTPGLFHSESAVAHLRPASWPVGYGDTAAPDASSPCLSLGRPGICSRRGRRPLLNRLPAADEMRDDSGHVVRARRGRARQPPRYPHLPTKAPSLRGGSVRGARERLLQSRCGRSGCGGRDRRGCLCRLHHRCPCVSAQRCPHRYAAGPCCAEGRTGRVPGRNAVAETGRPPGGGGAGCEVPGRSRGGPFPGEPFTPRAGRREGPGSPCSRGQSGSGRSTPTSVTDAWPVFPASASLT